MCTHSVANRVGGLRTFFGWLSHKGYTKGHLLEDLRSPKRAEQIIERLTLDEINRIFSGMNPATALGGRNTALVSLMLDCGFRVSEEANLKADDLHRDSRYLKVMGKGSKERMISFGVSCQKALLQYYHYFRPEPAHPGVDTLFLSIDGYPMTASSIQSVIKRLAKSSGVPRMYPHLLRHTYATMYLLNGGDVFTLQQNLGHGARTGHRSRPTVAFADKRGPPSLIYSAPGTTALESTPKSTLGIAPSPPTPSSCGA